MKNNAQIGLLLIFSSLALLIPYTILTVIFDYPNILRQDTADILTQFNQGGNQLIFTWFAFALTGIPLIPAYILIGKQFENQSGLVRIATLLGVMGLVAQLIGLLRWTFVVPVLAQTFVSTTDPAIKAAVVISFETIHQFAGVLLGEHLGQLFTVAWTGMISYALAQVLLIPKSLAWFGYLSGGIYLSAQAELLSTVIPSFPFWNMAGFIGSTLWLIWLILLGVFFLKRR